MYQSTLNREASLEFNSNQRRCRIRRRKCLKVYANVYYLLKLSLSTKKNN